MKKLASVLLALCMMVVACATASAAHQQFFGDEVDGYIYMTGMSNANQPPPAGYRSAKVLADRDLAEYLNEMHITSETTVINQTQAGDTVTTRLNAVCKGGQVVDKWRDSEGYYVTIRVPMHGANSVVAAVADIIPFAPVPAPIPAPEVIVSTNTSVVINPTVGNYTGVIVDCTGLGIQTAMAPGIFTPDLQAIYGLENFSNDFVINRGYVGYSKSMNSGVARAGANPLIVKANAVHRFVNPVISPEDAGRILAENRVSGFLSRGSVVFVR